MQSSVKTPFILEVGARPSKLSMAQVQEVWNFLRRNHPEIEFVIHPIVTIGDRDQKTSLRTLDRTDFFTREIDHWVLEKKGRIGIHSAKDLPASLPEGLEIFCITEGIDSSDALVFRSGCTLDTLAIGARIATSSIRREKAVQQIKSHLNFCDIRGTIEQRLAKLESGEVDGVVIAEAALIRLQLTHLNRIMLPGPSAEGQGKLAVVGHVGDVWIKKFCI